MRQRVQTHWLKTAASNAASYVFNSNAPTLTNQQLPVGISPRCRVSTSAKEAVSLFSVSLSFTDSHSLSVPCISAVAVYIVSMAHYFTRLFIHCIT